MPKKLVLALLVLSGATSASTEAMLPPREAYVGSEQCGACHPAKFDAWKATYHSTVVQDPREVAGAVLGDFGQNGLGFVPDDIVLTVGGHWYQRYLTRIDGELYALPKAWSVASHRWEDEDRWSWRKKPYRQYCIGCHATRYEPETGSYVEHTVGCEACHGPGGRHAEARGGEAILNPSHLPTDEQDLLCASCHVRGTDPTGVYRFPVGFVPGLALEDTFVPARIMDGETRREALLRQFREWKARVERGQPPACDVCGIKRTAATDPNPSSECGSCHKFADNYPAHTRHPSGVGLRCLDCHRLTESPSGETSDVHAPQFFLVHRRSTFDVDVVKACQDCHTGVQPEALRAQMRQWDHRDHAILD